MESGTAVARTDSTDAGSVGMPEKMDERTDSSALRDDSVEASPAESNEVGKEEGAAVVAAAELSWGMGSATTAAIRLRKRAVRETIVIDLMIVED